MFPNLFQNLNKILLNYESHKLFISGDFNATPSIMRRKINRMFNRSPTNSEKERDAQLANFLKLHELACCNSILGTSIHEIGDRTVASLIDLVVTNTPALVHQTKPLAGNCQLSSTRTISTQCETQICSICNTGSIHCQF